jgi:hypothetical protein
VLQLLGEIIGQGLAGASALHCFARFVIFGSFLFCTHKNTMPQKLTRAQIRAGLDQVPIESLLSSGEGKKPQLTHKQREFARAIALGQSKASAYRGSHKANPAPSTIKNAPYILAADSRIQREIEAYKLAIEAEKHRTPAQLKALLVQQLVEHSLNDDFPPAQRMKALQLIGQLFEVGAFLERKESVIIHKSADIRARLLDRLQQRAPSAGPATDALELLEEIKGGSTSEAASGDPTAPGAPPAGPRAPGALSHTVSDIQSLDSGVSLIQTLEKKEGGPSKNPDETVLDFDKE